MTLAMHSNESVNVHGRRRAWTGARAWLVLPAGALFALCCHIGILHSLGEMARSDLTTQRQQFEHLVLRELTNARHDSTRAHLTAVEVLRQALRTDDDHADAVSQYAYSLTMLADRGVKGADDQTVGDAVEMARTRARNHPLSVAAQMAMLRRSGDSAAAEALARTMHSEVSLLVPVVRIEIGKALLAQGKVGDAVAIADTLAAASDVAGLTFAATAYRAVGDVFKARRALESAIEAEPTHDPARALRVLIIIEQEDVGSLPVALDDVGALLELGDEKLGTRQLGYATLGRALVSKRLRPDTNPDVSSDLAVARGLLSNDPETPFFEAVVATDEGRLDDAMTLVDEAIALDPFRIGPYLALIEVASRAQKFALADTVYSNGEKIFGDNLALGLTKSKRLVAEKRLDDALNHLSTMLKMFDRAEVHREIGKVSLLKRDAHNAISSLKKAAHAASALDPATQAVIYMWLGRAFAQASEHRNAKAAYAQALAVSSAVPAAHYWLALSLEALKQDDEAKEAFTAYLEAEPSGRYAEEARRHIEGASNVQVIARIFTAHKDDLTACYADELKHDPELSAEVSVRLVIGRKGRVSQAGITKQRNVSGQLERCVLSRIKSWTFPRADQPDLVVIQPISFRPAGAGDSGASCAHQPCAVSDIADLEIAPRVGTRETPHCRTRRESIRALPADTR